MCSRLHAIIENLALPQCYCYYEITMHKKPIQSYCYGENRDSTVVIYNPKTFMFKLQMILKMPQILSSRSQVVSGALFILLSILLVAQFSKLSTDLAELNADFVELSGSSDSKFEEGVVILTQSESRCQPLFNYNVRQSISINWLIDIITHFFRII